MHQPPLELPQRGVVQRLVSLCSNTCAVNLPKNNFYIILIQNWLIFYYFQEIFGQRHQNNEFLKFWFWKTWFCKFWFCWFCKIWFCKFWFCSTEISWNVGAATSRSTIARIIRLENRQSGDVVESKFCRHDELMNFFSNQFKRCSVLALRSTCFAFCNYFLFLSN